MRKFLYYSAYIPTLVLVSLLLITLGLLVPVRVRQRYGTRWNHFVSKTWFCLVYGVRIEIEGAENLPAAPYVAIANHQCEWETLFLGWFLRPVNIILKQELLRIPFFGWGLRSMNAIGIDRGNARESIRRIETEGLKRLQAGGSMLIFPESTRVPPGEYRRFTRTAAKLAIEAGVPIVPIAHDAGHCWTPGGTVHAGKTIHLWVGKPLQTAGGDAKPLTEETEAWIREKAGLAKE